MCIYPIENSDDVAFCLDELKGAIIERNLEYADALYAALREFMAELDKSLKLYEKICS